MKVRLMRRWLPWLIGVALAIPLGMWGYRLALDAYDRSEVIDWVGHTDIEIEFLVTDAADGSPVGGALIAAYSYGGLCFEDRRERWVALVTGADGSARHVAKECMCSGVRSRLGRTDTFFAHLPSWRFRVSAPEYRTSEEDHLADWAFKRIPERIGPRLRSHVIPIALHRGPPDQLLYLTGPAVQVFWGLKLP